MMIKNLPSQKTLNAPNVLPACLSASRSLTAPGKNAPNARTAPKPKLCTMCKKAPRVEVRHSVHCRSCARETSKKQALQYSMSHCGPGRYKELLTEIESYWLRPA